LRYALLALCTSCAMQHPQKHGSSPAVVLQ